MHDKFDVLAEKIINCKNTSKEELSLFRRFIKVTRTELQKVLLNKTLNIVNQSDCKYKKELLKKLNTLIYNDFKCFYYDWLLDYIPKVMGDDLEGKLSDNRISINNFDSEMCRNYKYMDKRLMPEFDSQADEKDCSSISYRDGADYFYESLFAIQKTKSKGYRDPFLKVAEHCGHTTDNAKTYDTRLTGFAFQLFYDFYHDIFSQYGQAIGVDLDIPFKSIWEIGAERRKISTYINYEGKEKKVYPAWGFEEYKLLLSLNMFEQMTGFIKVNHIYSALRTKMKTLEVSSCGALDDTVKQLAKIRGFFTGIKCSQLLIYDMTDEHADSVKKRNELIFCTINKLRTISRNFIEGVKNAIVRKEGVKSDKKTNNPDVLRIGKDLCLYDLAFKFEQSFLSVEHSLYLVDDDTERMWRGVNSIDDCLEWMTEDIPLNIVLNDIVKRIVFIKKGVINPQKVVIPKNELGLTLIEAVFSSFSYRGHALMLNVSETDNIKALLQKEYAYRVSLNRKRYQVTLNSIFNPDSLIAWLEQQYIEAMYVVEHPEVSKNSKRS